MDRLTTEEMELLAKVNPSIIEDIIISRQRIREMQKEWSQSPKGKATRRRYYQKNKEIIK